MIKINLLKEIEKSKKVELEPQKEDSVPIQKPQELPQEVETPQIEPEIVNEEEIKTADNFDDVEEKETLVEKIKELKEEIEVESPQKEEVTSVEEQTEEKRSPFRPIKFDTNTLIEDEEKVEDETNQKPLKTETIKEETVVSKDSEPIEDDINPKEISKQELTTEKKSQDSENKEDEEESVIIDEDKPAIPFRVVESSIEDDDDEVAYDDFTGSKMPHILVAIAIFAVIASSGYYLWTMNDDLVETVAERNPSEKYQEEIPTETAKILEESKSDQEISAIVQEENFSFDESDETEKAPETIKESKMITETASQKPIVEKESVKKNSTTETTFTTTGNVNFNKITLANALILKREVSAGEFKITCFSQKKFTRGVVAEFKKRGGYSQLNINVRTDIRDGKIGDLVVFSGKN